MAKKDVENLMKTLNNYNNKDITIALMAIENNNVKIMLDQKLYNCYELVYNYYFEKRDDLTGLLNEVLQNPNKIYNEYIKKSKSPH